MNYSLSPRPSDKVSAYKAVVERSTGSFYRVRTETGEVLECTLRGKMRLIDSTTTNPVAVGDYVRLTEEENKTVIAEVLPRDNYVLRKAPKAGVRNQILCANVDQAIILATVDYPVTTLGAIDRFLVMLEAFGITGVVVFNKIDLLTKEKEIQKLSDYLSIYEQAGYQTLAVNATDPEERDEVVALLKDKVTFIGGVSGAGKSTFINLADPHLCLKTAAISTSSNRGKHTTTFAELFPLSFGGAIIDAPGFRDFMITEVGRSELSHYYPEMRALLSGCKFHNCTHIDEPECAVKDAVESGEIALSRYHTYLGMFGGGCV